MADQDALFECAEEFLGACLTALELIGNAPECYYISPGPPPYDYIPCLSVYVGGPVLGDTLPLQPSMAPGHRMTVAGEVNLINMTATILRCAPVLDDEGGGIQPVDFNTASKEMYADLWAIWMYLKQAKIEELLFPPAQREFELLPAVAINQQGGACGWQIPVRTNLYGYKPIIGS